MRTVRIVHISPTKYLNVQFQLLNVDSSIKQILASINTMEITQEIGDLITLFMHHDIRFTEELAAYNPSIKW